MMTLGHFFNNDKPVIGFAKPIGPPVDPDNEPMTEQQKLLERIAEQIIEQYSDALKKLGDE